MNNYRKTNEAQQRILKIVEFLFSDVVHGYRPAQIARQVGTSPSSITRAMDNLRTAGWATHDEETGCWRLTPLIGQQAVKIYSALERHRARVEEAANRYTRNSD